MPYTLKITTIGGQIKNNKPGMIESAYQQLLSQNKLVADPNQQKVVQALQGLHDELMHASADDSSILDRITTLISNNKQKQCTKGLYIWGGVGRGKTFLMDLFFNNLHSQKKLRLHFHRFMEQAHTMMKSYRSEQDPLRLVAAEFATKAEVLCFDEFFVNDIGDAMILAGLLQGLFENNIALIATSNVEPSLLYKDGLQRERFLPTIKLLQEHTNIIHLEGEIDHRFEFLQTNDVYKYPIDSSTIYWLKNNYRNLANELVEHSWEKIKINDREIQTVQHTDTVVWFDFKEICDGPRSASDYIAIAKQFNIILISNIPIFKAKDDQARRFINMVDEFYDRNVKLILSAQASPAKLYQGTRLQAEFGRTVSRLTEMQSHEYLEKQHQPN